MKTLRKQFVLIIAMLLLLILLPGRALAITPEPSFSISASPQTLNDGEMTQILVTIKNTADVHIMPTCCKFNGQSRRIISGFMHPGDTIVVDCYYTADFQGAMSEELSLWIIYHEDGEHDVCSTDRSLTLYNAAPTPAPMNIITPAPTQWNPVLITAEPTESLPVIIGEGAQGVMPTDPPNNAPLPSVITPVPTAQNLPVVSQQGAQGEMSSSTPDYRPVTPMPMPSSTPDSLPQMPETTPQPAQVPDSSDSDEEIVVLSNETQEPRTTDKNLDMKIARNHTKSLDTPVTDKLSFAESLMKDLDGFAIFGLALILVFGFTGLVLLIIVNITKSKN